MAYIIHCKVSGGVTGTRESYLKDSGGLKIYETLEECQAECDRLRNSMGRYSPASFSYWPEKAKELTT